MGAVLSEIWLGGAEATPILDAASVAVVRERVRAQGAELGLSESVTGSLVNVASELGHNQLAHARRGRLALRTIERDGVPGLELIAADEGSGLCTPAAALRAEPRIPQSSDPALRTSLGVGLAAVLEHADELDFDVRLGEGTCIWARKFAREVPRRREVGIYGRALAGETINGDDAAFVRDAAWLLVGVADGLGHGHAARSASQPALEVLRSQAAAPLEQILLQAHGALQRTRGAVMATARVHEPSGELESASVGNAAVRLRGPQQSQRFTGRSAVLGTPGRLRMPLTERGALGAHDVLILFSDGLTSRADFEGELGLLREHPIVIAERLVERFGRDNDDVLVLVAR